MLAPSPVWGSVVGPAILALTLFAQQPSTSPDPPASERSHVERFAPRQRLQERAEREATARLRENPDDVQALEARALARIQLNRTNEALEDLTRAARLNERSAYLRAQLAYCLWLRGSLPEALAAARQALALDADNFSARYYAGRLSLLTATSDADVDAAIEHLQRAIELNPEEVDIRFDLLNAYRRRGDLVRAGVQLRLLRAAYPPNYPRVLYTEGLLATDLGQLSTGIDRFRQALLADPALAAARRDLGIALIQSERWQEALEVLEPLTRDHPQAFTAAYFHALALQNLQRLPEAEEETRRAVALDPRSADAHTLLGIILAGRGAHAEAVASLEQATKLDSQSFDAWFYLGRARYALRDFSGARDALHTAVQFRPEDAEAHFFLATALEVLGEKDAAIAEYRALIGLRPEDARGHAGLGNLLARYGRSEEAIPALQRARELDPANFEAALALGRMLARRQQWEQAVTLLREAVARVPESAEAHYQLGLALRRTGHAQDAAQQFTIVERLNRKFRSRGAGMESLTPTSQRP